MTDPDKKKSATVSRGKMLALMAIYAMPLLAAWVWLEYVRNNEGAGVSVNGELIKPAVPLNDFKLTDAAGDPWSVDEVRGIWSMVYFAGNECDEVCEKALYNMRQVRLSTGRRMERLQRVLVTPQVKEMDTLLENASEGLAVVGGSVAQITGFKQQVLDAQTGMTTCSNCVYMVDPFGNVMMRFNSDLDPGKMLKDVMHLLKVSRIG